jgi:hypothetical protein
MNSSNNSREKIESSDIFQNHVPNNSYQEVTREDSFVGKDSVTTQDFENPFDFAHESQTSDTEDDFFELKKSQLLNEQDFFNQSGEDVESIFFV